LNETLIKLHIPGDMNRLRYGTQLPDSIGIDRGLHQGEIDTAQRTFHDAFHPDIPGKGS
jgi:hypothetical protein